MSKLPPIPYGSLFFAPMEGVTEESYRKTILKLYPEWDYLACDFLRVPSAGHYPRKHLVRHFGEELIQIPWIVNKTMYQILTSHTAFTADMVRDLVDLGIPWVDVNIGCPSTQVCKNKGGSFLLQDLPRLATLMKTIRENFPGRLTAKIRTGYTNTNGFEDSIKLLCDVGVECITVHGRTREQMYKEPANWRFIEKAVRVSQVPIIGNGDIWSSQDIDRMLKETGCHGVMVARGAMKFPWMAQSYRRGHFEELSSERLQKMKVFFVDYRANLEASGITVRGLLKQSKSVSRFMLDGIDGGDFIKRKLLLSQTVPEFYSVLETI